MRSDITRNDKLPFDEEYYSKLKDSLVEEMDVVQKNLLDLTDMIATLSGNITVLKNILSEDLTVEDIK